MELGLSQWCPVKPQAQSYSFVVFAQRPPASTYSLYFFLVFGRLFCCQAQSCATLHDVPVVSDTFCVPHKVTCARLYSTEIQ